MDPLFTLSDRLQELKPSPTLELNALAKSMQAEDIDVVNLTAGETNFSTDPSIQSAATRAMKEGKTRYTPANGIPALRKRVAQWYGDRWGIPYLEEQITVSSGIKQGFFNTILALVNPGSEVLIPTPYWVSYPPIVKLAGGIPVWIPTNPEDGFQIDPKVIANAISSKTRLLILNSPNNPTGAIQRKENLEAIAKVLEGTNILVLSDEIYGELVYEDLFCSFATLSEDAYRRTVTMNGLSKSHAMTGWRVGFIAGEKSLIKAVGTLQGQSISNITSFVQPAAQVALDLPASYMDNLRETLRINRDIAVEHLAQEKEITLKEPQGAFYCFPDISCYFKRKTPDGVTINSSVDLSKYLLKSALVAIVPGSAFGEDRCIRISFSVEKKSLEKGMGRLISAFQKLSK